MWLRAKLRSKSIRHNLPACKERARVVEQNVNSRGGVEQGASERNNLIAVGEIRIVHLSGDAGYPGAQARKCRLSSVAVATDEHEPGTERTEFVRQLPAQSRQSLR